MNESLDINTGELTEFKSQLKQWLAIDEEINKYENKIKELKNLKKKNIRTTNNRIYGKSQCKRY